MNVNDAYEKACGFINNTFTTIWLGMVDKIMTEIMPRPELDRCFFSDGGGRRIEDGWPRYIQLNCIFIYWVMAELVGSLR